MKSAFPSKRLFRLVTRLMAMLAFASASPAWAHFCLNDPLDSIDPFGLTVAKAAMYGATFFGYGEDGHNYIDQGADSSLRFTSTDTTSAFIAIFNKFDKNKDGKLDCNDSPPFDLRITGYSWGGWSVLQVAQMLEQSNKLVDKDLLVMRIGIIDAVSTLRSPNVGRTATGIGGPRGSGIESGLGPTTGGGVSVTTRPSRAVYAVNYYETIGLPYQFGDMLGQLFVGTSLPLFNTDKNVSDEAGMNHVEIVRRHGPDVAREIFGADGGN